MGAAHALAANDADGPAALVPISDILWYGDRLEKFFGDGSYGGVLPKLASWGNNFERASRVVERSIAWTERTGAPFFRRIVKDYECKLSSSVGWLILANIQMMLQRIKPTNQI